MHSIIRWILIAAVIAAGGLPIEASAFQKCIFIYAPVADPPPVPGHRWLRAWGLPGLRGVSVRRRSPGVVRLRRWRLYRTNDCSNTPTATSWMQQSYPGRIATCNNPCPFGSLDGSTPRPRQINVTNTDPVNHKVNWLGDPVDLTNGASSKRRRTSTWGAASSSLVTTQATRFPPRRRVRWGRDGRHSLDWKVQYQRSSRPGPTTRSRKSRSSGGRSERQCRFSVSRSLRPRRPMFRSRRGQVAHTEPEVYPAGEQQPPLHGRRRHAREF